MLRKLLAASAAFFMSVAAFGATLVPIQLLNPTGSVANQALVSAGASSAPAWASIVNSVAGRTGAVTLSVGDVSGAAPASSPTLTTPNIVGVTNGSNASVGSVGEFPGPTNLSGASITSGTPLNASSISLAPGDYEIQASVAFTGAASTVATYFQVGVSSTSATFAAFPNNTTLLGVSVTGSNGVPVVSSPVVRISLSATTTIYAVAQSFFSTSTMTVSGNLHIRRVR